MKYKKGSAVEVLKNCEVPYGSWRCAEIISGDGQNFMVRYDKYPGVYDKVVVERVSRKSIRPSPPPLKVYGDWIDGDVVEVFHNLSWKMARVYKALGWNKFLVRLVGFSHEFQVSKFDMRVCQSWQDDGWIVIGKVSKIIEDGKCNELSDLKHNQNASSQFKKKDAKLSFRVRNHCVVAQNGNHLQEFRNISSRTLKRGSPDCYFQVEANDGAAKKFRVTGRFHPPTNFSKKNVERVKSKGTFGYSHDIRLEPNDTYSVTSSVGSCSITSCNIYKFPFKSGHIEETGDHSDAESFCQMEYEVGRVYPPTNEELEMEIHRLELHAYRCTMEALHASGPLSWEKETLVTELRMSLHISNDEHLMEIRNLVSGATPHR